MDRYKMIRVLTIICLAVNLAFPATALSADDDEREQILYDAVRQGDTVSDIGCVLKETGDGKTLLEVSILTKGQGANFRRWMPDRPYVLADSERITPIKTEKFYASKQSLAHGVAPIVFAAIGSQYVGHAGRAASSPGTPCPVGPHASTIEEHHGTAEAIDRVGMAAGLGLLSAQAQGEITGLKTTYDVTGFKEAMSKALLKFQVANKHTRQQLDVTVPLRFSTAPEPEGPPDEAGGGKGPKPPPVSAPKDESKMKRCGPDVTDDYLTRLKIIKGRILSHRKIIKKMGYVEVGEFSFMRKNGMKMDYWVYPTANCPKNCDETLTLVGLCVNQSATNDIIYGFVGRLLDMDLEYLIGAADWHEVAARSDISGKPPVKVAGYSVGYDLAREADITWDALRRVMETVSVNGQRAIDLMAGPHRDCELCTDKKGAHKDFSQEVWVLE